VLSYSAAGGPAGNGHVSFNRAESDFLDAGTRTLNIASNGGFTIVTVVRFTGSAPGWDRIIDFGDLAIVKGNGMILAGTPGQMNFQLFTAGSLVVGIYSSSTTIVQNTWHTIIARYDASTWAAEMRVDGVVVGTATASAALPDMTVKETIVGTSLNYDRYLNADMAGLLVVDQYLDLATAVALADAMKTSGVSGGTCLACPAGTPPTLPPPHPSLAAVIM
jgi:hypothetical protein